MPGALKPCRGYVRVNTHRAVRAPLRAQRVSLRVDLPDVARKALAVLPVATSTKAHANALDMLWNLWPVLTRLNENGYDNGNDDDDDDNDDTGHGTDDDYPDGA